MIVSRVVQLALRWGLTSLRQLTTVINQHLTEILLNIFHNFLIDVISSCCRCSFLSETTLILVSWWLKLHITLELGVSLRHIGLNIIALRTIIPSTTHFVIGKVHLLIIVCSRGVLALV
jgi:hypothetical protein